MALNVFSVRRGLGWLWLVVPLVIAFVVYIVAIYWRTDYIMHDQWFWLWLAGIIGFLIGLSELLNRYKAFLYIFSNGYSWLYMGVNMSAGMIAYALIIRYDLKLGDIGRIPVGKSIIAGIGAMTFLRSSVFSYKDSAGKPVDVGPAALLNVILKATERQFDQAVTFNTLARVDPIMKGIDFVSASKDLPELINRSMRVLSTEEQTQLSSEIVKLLKDDSITEASKSIFLGMIMEKYTGVPLLRAAVEALKRIYDDNKDKFEIQDLK